MIHFSLLVPLNKKNINERK